MFIRKNPRIYTTVFDITNETSQEKIDLFNSVKELETESIKTLTEPGKTRLVFVIPVRRENNSVAGSRSLIHTLLFNDILGYSHNTDSSTYKGSRIINTSAIRMTQSVKKGFVATESGLMMNKNETISDNLVGIDNERVEKLMWDNHKRLLKKSPKEIVEYNTCYNYYHSNKQLNNVLKLVTNVVSVDTVCSLSELYMTLNNWANIDEFCRNSFPSNYNYDRIYVQPSDQRVVETLNDCLTKLFIKYNITDTKVWECVRDKIKNRFRQDSVYSSFYKEHMTLTTIEPSLNIFIPVTYVLFIEDGLKLFNSHTSIIKEEYKKSNPQFFVNKIAFSQDTGWPMNFMQQQEARGYMTKEQTSESVLPPLVKDDFYLSQTLLLIPNTFSKRLLKTKLNNLKNPKFSTISIQERSYCIPESSLQQDLMSCYYFFNEEQCKSLSSITPKTSLSPLKTMCYFYTILFDGRIDLSYYTQGIYERLLNRFAETGRTSVSSPNVGAIIVYPNILSSKRQDLKALYDCLNNRHQQLTQVFNSDEVTLISKEMLLYEKTLLTFIYLLDCVGIKSLRYKKTKRGATTSKEISGKIRDNDCLGLVSENLLRILFYQEPGDIVTSSQNPCQDMYLLETLYTLVSTLTEEDLIDFLQKTIDEIKSTIRITIQNLINNVNLGSNLVKELEIERNNTVFPNVVSSLLRKVLRKSCLHPSHNHSLNLYRVLSKKHPKELLTILITRLVVYEHLTKIHDGIYAFTSLLSYTNSIISFLTKVQEQSEVFNRYAMYGYDLTDQSFNRICEILKENASLPTDKQITRSEDFTDLLVKEFHKEYISIPNS